MGETEVLDAGGRQSTDFRASHLKFPHSRELGMGMPSRLSDMVFRRKEVMTLVRTRILPGAPVSPW